MSSGLLLFALIVFASSPLLFAGSTNNGVVASQLRSYIVHVMPPEDAVLSTSDDIRQWHLSFLPETTSAYDGESRLLYSYSDAYSGFAARLTEDELEVMEETPGFVSAMPDEIYPLLTTHTPEFLGLHLGAGSWNRSNLGKGVIIGLLDTGIISTHVSFHDDGVPPPPSKWKGTCEQGDVCNNKIIGTKYFTAGSSTQVVKPAADNDGHGTHTASTAAGNFVNAASVSALANGTAAGVAPHAHLALYKVCSAGGCSTSDILAGLDAAVKDSVDVISLSLGGSPLAFFDDPIAIGSFRAIEKGIFVSAAGGNSGPVNGSVSNSAPWLLTVAASTIDRRMTVTARMGNGEEIDGESLYQPQNFTSESLPLAYFSDNDFSSQCLILANLSMENKVVVCDNGARWRASKVDLVKQNNGAGVILVNSQNEGYTTLAVLDALPASEVSFDAGSKIRSYIKSTENPTVLLIFKGAKLGNLTAPEIAYFSSRGPNRISFGILKPDITGPGVNILAAWPVSVSDGSEKRPDNHSFNIISGTSMATPHLSGVAALVKSVHPDWSPAAIKSAILTTAYYKANDGRPIKDERHLDASIYATGSGHVDPTRVTDPGLVYDIDTNEYISYLCGLGYDDRNVSAVVGAKISCSNIKSIKEWELNYPNILLPLKESGSVTVTRMVTNVGNAQSTYTADVEAPKGASVTVEPETLQFSRVNEKQSFNVTVTIEGILEAEAKGQLNWVSGDYAVRSIIAKMTVQ